MTSPKPKRNAAIGTENYDARLTVKMTETMLEEIHEYAESIGESASVVTRRLWRECFEKLNDNETRKQK